jgi:hypothetical protein
MGCFSKDVMLRSKHGDDVSITIQVTGIISDENLSASRVLSFSTLEFRHSTPFLLLSLYLLEVTLTPLHRYDLFIYLSMINSTLQ